LKKLVVLDELTGAYTIEHLRSELERELHKTSRYKHPTSLLVIELGQLDGRSAEEVDDVLVRTAGFLVSNLRNVDVLFRIGELRFAALLPETPLDGAAVAASRLEARIPDITSQYGFDVDVVVHHLGWGEDAAPATDEVIDRITGPLDALGG